MSLETAIQELAKSNYALAEAIKVDTAARYYVAERLGFSGIAAPAPVESQEATQPTPDPEQTYKPEGFKAVNPVETVEEAEKVEAEQTEQPEVVPTPEPTPVVMDEHEYRQAINAVATRWKTAFGAKALEMLRNEVLAPYGVTLALKVPAECRRDVVTKIESVLAEKGV